MNKYEKIENAICDLEKIICDELDIDLGHPVLRTLNYHGDRRNLRDSVERYQYNEAMSEIEYSYLSQKTINELST